MKKTAQLCFAVLRWPPRSPRWKPAAPSSATFSIPQSGAVQGATITVTNAQTNVVTTLHTNESGYYKASLLIAGTYSVRVEAPGFKAFLRDGLDLPVGARLQVDVRLEVGGVAETVTVNAGIDLIDANTLSSGQVMEEKSILDLPNPGGNTMVLAKLAPGLQSSQTEGNVRVIRSHIVPFTAAWLDAADEEGVAVSHEGTWPWLMLRGPVPDAGLLALWKQEYLSLIPK